MPENVPVEMAKISRRAVVSSLSSSSSAANRVNNNNNNHNIDTTQTQATAAETATNIEYLNPNPSTFSQQSNTALDLTTTLTAIESSAEVTTSLESASETAPSSTSSSTFAKNRRNVNSFVSERKYARYVPSADISSSYLVDIPFGNAAATGYATSASAAASTSGGIATVTPDPLRSDETQFTTGKIFTTTTTG